MYVRCVKSLNKANKQHRKRSIKQATRGTLLAFIIGEMEDHTMEVKRYLGFTDGIKEPRKTKVKNELSRSYRYNGKIYNAVTFFMFEIIRRLLS